MASDSAHHVRLRPIRTTPTKKPPPPPFCAEELGRGLHSQSEEDSENVSAVHDADDADYEPLTPASRVFCSPSLNMTILVTFGLKTSCNIDALKEGLKSTLLRHKRFCSVVVSELSFSSLFLSFSILYLHAKEKRRREGRNVIVLVRLWFSIGNNLRDTPAFCFISSNAPEFFFISLSNAIFQWPLSLSLSLV